MKTPCLFDVALAAALSLAIGSGRAWAAPQEGPLADEPQVVQALSAQPAWQLALQLHRAELSRAEATAASPHEWSPSASWARRTFRPDATQPARAGERDWSLGLSRGLRLPDKAEAADAWGQRQRERADAQLAVSWLELGRALVQDAGECLLASRQAQLWWAHWQLQQEQHRNVSRRHELGDAARQDVILLDAARSQAESSWLQARQQAQLAEARWRARHPGIAVPQWSQAEPLLSGDPPAAQTAEAIEARLMVHPAARKAELDAAVAAAQSRHADTDRRPDPTVGVQVGRDANGAERVWGVNVSWPLGGVVRSRQAEAAAAEARAAEAGLDEVRRELRLSLQRWADDVGMANQAWQAQALAASQTAAAAQALRKGQELGHVGVGEVLLMQRQLIEQQQAEAAALVQAWQARTRWALESGVKWAMPPVD